jgi:hypothetical protein
MFQKMQHIALTPPKRRIQLPRGPRAILTTMAIDDHLPGVSAGSNMQRVDHYFRQAKAARELAATANSHAVRAQLENIAKTWEQLASRALVAVAAQDRRGVPAPISAAI